MPSQFSACERRYCDLVHALPFRCLGAGTPLVHPSTKQPVNDKSCQQLVFCQGNGISPSTVRLFAVALTKIHSRNSSPHALASYVTSEFEIMAIIDIHRQFSSKKKTQSTHRFISVQNTGKYAIPSVSSGPPVMIRSMVTIKMDDAIGRGAHFENGLPTIIFTRPWKL